MAYIGNPILTTDYPVNTFSGNGSTTAFTLSLAPASVNSILVAVSGVIQDPSTYTVSGTTLTFTAAPPSGTSNISVRHLGIAGIPNTPSAGSVITASIADANVTAAKIADGSITRAKVSTSEADSFAFCRAWVNFNGTSTVAIREDFNVSSITDGGTGIYTVNFTNAMPDANYAVVGMAKFISGAAGENISVRSVAYSTAVTTTAVIVNTSNAGNATFADSEMVNVAIFR